MAIGRHKLVRVANQLLNDDTQIGIEDCKIVEQPDKADTDEIRTE